MGRLSRTLQADQHQDRRGRIVELQPRLRAAHQADQLVVNDLDNGLRGRQGRQHVGADRLLLDRVDELFGDRKVDVGLEQRDANFPRDFVDVGFGQPSATSEPLEDRAQAFA